MMNATGFVAERSTPLLTLALGAAGALILLSALVACHKEEKAASQAVRPVRTVTVELQEGGENVSLTGEIQPRYQADLGFRVLMVRLQSFQKMFLMISIAPLGLIGVVAAPLPTGTPMGFVAIFGIIALSGMIIRNSVILIDRIDMDMAKGSHPWDAVIDATTNRFRPIVLTAAAASLGMIPIASEVFWGPMAYAIIGGVFVATLLTLLFLLALYVVWFRVKEPAKEQHVGVPEPARAVTV
jgi:hypothetical protein